MSSNQGKSRFRRKLTKEEFDYLRRFFFLDETFRHFAREALLVTFTSRNRFAVALMVVAGVVGAVNASSGPVSRVVEQLRNTLAGGFGLATTAVTVVLAGFAIFAATATTSVGTELGRPPKNGGRPEAYELVIYFFASMLPMILVLALHMIASTLAPPGSQVSAQLWAWFWDQRWMLVICGFVVAAANAWMILGLLSLVSNINKTYLMMTGVSLSDEWKSTPLAGGSLSVGAPELQDNESPHDSVVPTAVRVETSEVDDGGAHDSAEENLPQRREHSR